jgi:hypothetical protein
MSKKYLNLSLALLLMAPFIVEAKSMFEENFEREQKELKSESTALLGSLACTAAPLILAGTLISGNSEEFGLCIGFGGVVLGPSLGHFYAEQPGRGIQGIMIRTSIVVGITGFSCLVTKDSDPDSRGFTVLSFKLCSWSVRHLHNTFFGQKIQ